MQSNLTEKTFVLTGATSGIGLAAAELLARAGARLIGVGRAPSGCRECQQRLSAQYPQAQVRYLSADLSEQRQVHQLADQIGALLPSLGSNSLDGLLNNAGTFTYWLSLTPDGIETQWAVNHLAAFLLTRRLLPLLQAAPAARVVTVSSDSHYTAHLDWRDPQLRRHYNGLGAYGNTKLANILFTLALRGHLGTDSCVRAFAADPGLVKTDIGLKGTPSIANLVWKIRRSGGISPEEAAAGILTLLTEPSIQEAPEVYWKHGQPKRPAAQALDREAAGRLWTLSAQMCAQPAEVCNVAA
jgi:NAD(P)-dependent dehydrogenase (short-subunit alcohol dehydrogenase family)